MLLGPLSGLETKAALWQLGDCGVPMMSRNGVCEQGECDPLVHTHKEAAAWMAMGASIDLLRWGIRHGVPRKLRRDLVYVAVCGLIDLKLLDRALEVEVLPMSWTSRLWDNRSLLGMAQVSKDKIESFLGCIGRPLKAIGLTKAWRSEARPCVGEWGPGDYWWGCLDYYWMDAACLPWKLTTAAVEPALQSNSLKATLRRLNQPMAKPLSLCMLRLSLKVLVSTVDLTMRALQLELYEEGLNMLDARVRAWCKWHERCREEHANEPSVGGFTNEEYWADITEPKEFLFESLPDEAITEGDELMRHGVLETPLARSIEWPNTGYACCKVRGLPTSDGHAASTPADHQRRIRSWSLISMDGRTFMPPEKATDEAVDNWGKWMSSLNESNSISESPGGAEYQIEGFKPIAAWEEGKHIKEYRKLMIKAQVKYLEVRAAKGSSYSKKEGEASGAPEEPGLLLFGGKSGKYLLKHGSWEAGDLGPPAPTAELIECFGKILLTHEKGESGVEQSVSIVTGLSANSTARHPRLELTPLRCPDKLESMSAGWFRSLGTVELQEEGMMTYDRMPIAYAKCVLAERFAIAELNDLKTGPRVMKLTEPLRMEGSLSKKADGDSFSTPGKTIQQNLFGGKKPDAGPNYKQHYSEMFTALNAKFMLTAKPKLMPMSPEKLTTCFLVSGSPVPQGMTDNE